MFLFPMRVDQETTLSAMLSGPLRCGAPSLVGAKGETHDGEVIYLVGFQWPQRYSVLGGREDAKRRNEERQLSRLRADLAASSYGDPFTDVGLPDSEPPDFLCIDRGGRKIGVEVTQLTSGERVEDQALFDRLRGELIKSGPSGFRKLSGHLVIASFMDEDGGSRKPSRPDDIKQLISALREYQPLPSRPDLPEQVEPERVVRFDRGVLCAAPLAQQPPGMFYDVMGFEFVLAVSESFLRRDAWAELAKRAGGNHDAIGVHTLVVSANAPTSSGVAFPADGLLAEAAIAHGDDAALACGHIERVWVHDWTARTVTELRPGERGSTLLA